MTDSERLALVRQAVEAAAARQTSDEADEDWFPGDNGNHDDSYSQGMDDGIIIKSRDILEILNR